MKISLKTNAKLAAVILATLLMTALEPVMALPVNLGKAGPQHFVVLEIGTGKANVSLADASNAGSITGNVGILSAGNFSDSGVPIKGDVYYGGSLQVNGNVAANITGSNIFGADALLNKAASDAVAASMAAAKLAASGGGVGVTAITGSGTLTPGVYNLTDLNLPNGAVLNLTAGGPYVFNISGTLALHSSKILLADALTPADVLYNVTGSQGVALSGGLNGESVLSGIILATNASVSVTPGAVSGEIISGQNIDLSGGGSILDPLAVHPLFFKGEIALGNDVYFLVFPDGNLFGYYTYDFFPYLYHDDMGFEYFIDANDGKGNAYLYDFTSGHFWYTGPALFPYIYDFSLKAWLYYFPDTVHTDHYTTNPRSFYNFATSSVITE